MMEKDRGTRYCMELGKVLEVVKPVENANGSLVA